MIVEDDEEMRRGLRLLLMDAGYEVVATGSVLGAFEALPSSTPDLALLDHVLGDGTAFDLLRAFAARGVPFPSVILTGTADADLAMKLKRCGARGFLTKPAEPDAVLAALERALEESPI